MPAAASYVGNHPLENASSSSSKTIRSPCSLAAVHPDAYRRIQQQGAVRDAMYPCAGLPAHCHRCPDRFLQPRTDKHRSSVKRSQDPSAGRQRGFYHPLICCAGRRTSTTTPPSRFSGSSSTASSRRRLLAKGCTAPVRVTTSSTPFQGLFRKRDAGGFTDASPPSTVMNRRGIIEARLRAGPDNPACVAAGICARPSRVVPK